MEMIGDYERFAVRYMLDPDFGNIWLFGKVCFWINGEAVGDSRKEESLRDFLLELDGRRHYRGQRRNDRLMALSTPHLIDVLDSKPSAQHDLSFALASFARWKVYLVELNEAARLIYRIDGGKPKECILAPGECDAILDAASRHVSALYMDEYIRMPWSQTGG